MRINITLKVDKNTYIKYRKLCDEAGLVVSRRFEKFMQREIRMTRKKLHEIEMDLIALLEGGNLTRDDIINLFTDLMNEAI